MDYSPFILLSQILLPVSSELGAADVPPRMIPASPSCFCSFPSRTEVLKPHHAIFLRDAHFHSDPQAHTLPCLQGPWNPTACQIITPRIPRRSPNASDHSLLQTARKHYLDSAELPVDGISLLTAGLGFTQCDLLTSHHCH